HTREPTAAHTRTRRGGRSRRSRGRSPPPREGPARGDRAGSLGGARRRPRRGCGTAVALVGRVLARSLALISLLTAGLGAGCAAEADRIGGDVSCTLTLEYWRAQETSWPVEELVLGAQTYARDELLPLL